MGMGQTGSGGRRAKRPVRAGRFRKGVAVLLALALLALSVGPASAAWPPAAAEHPGEYHDAAAGRGSHGPGAVPTTPDQEPPRGHHHDDGGDHLPPALACCVALHCPMLLADLRPAPAEPLPGAGLRVRAPTAARQPAGLDIRPALPPPRGGA